MDIYRKPPAADSTGDAIPFFHNGTYHIFSLTPPPGTTVYPDRLRTSYSHAVSDDLVHWRQLPTALAPGKEDEPDSCGVWTGSALFAEGQYHIFYTGYNYRAALPQTICHATSADGVCWEKDAANPVLVPDTARYESLDWRDPYVFYNETDGCYWLLVSARVLEGPPTRRGCVVCYRSADLQVWSHYGPVYTPFHTNCPECPEMYQMGDHWYLSYSRFSEFGNTVYRVGKSPFGPWRTPKQDGIGGRRFYAAKSMQNAQGRRFYFGWAHDRAQKADSGEWYWGGVFCLPHEVRPLADGSLAVSLPPEAEAVFQNPVGWEFTPMLGQVQLLGRQSVSIQSQGTFGYGLFRFEEQRFLFRCKVRPNSVRDQFGVLLKTDADCAQCLMLVFEAGMQRVSLLNLPMAVDPFWQASCTNIGTPKEPGPDGVRVAERPFPVCDDTVIDLKIVVDNDLVEVFAGETAAFTYRLYAPAEYPLGLFVQDGDAEFFDISILYSA